jgi:hypothetical protein
MIKFFLVSFIMLLNFVLCLSHHYLSANSNTFNQKVYLNLKDTSEITCNDTLRFYSVREVFETYQLKK